MVEYNGGRELMVNQQIIDQLKAAGFQDTLPQPPQRAIVDMAAEEKSGKSHFALTGPAPIIYHSIDVGTEGVVEKFQSTKEILVKEILYQQGEPQSVYQDMWNTFKDDWALGLTAGYGTVVCDTWTEIYELARLARFGKLEQVQAHHYGPVYAELKKLIRDIYDTKMSAVLLSKMGREYGTTNMEVKGYKDTCFLVQMNLRAYRTLGSDGKPVYSLTVKDTRLNAKNLTNLTLSSVNEDGVDRFDFSQLIWLAHNWEV